MAAYGSPERGQANVLGANGKPKNNWMKYGLIAVVLMMGGGFVLSQDDQPVQMRSMEGNVTEIAATAPVNLVLPPNQTAATTVPQQVTQPQQGGGLVLPDAMTAGTGSEVKRPRRVTSFAVSEHNQGPSAPSRPQVTATEGQPGQQQPQSTTIAFAGTTMPGLRAGRAMDMTLVMQPGLYSMTLLTPINSERDGDFFAILPHPIKSRMGVTLMEAGSTIQGSYKSQISQGQSRIVTAVARGMTPNGVPVPFGDAAGADGDGRLGVPGTLKTHLGARLGSALTLMVTQGAFQAATTALQAAIAGGGQGGNTFFNMNSSGLDAAVAAAVRNGSSIQNTVDVEAGRTVAFMLSVPVDFSDAYSLTPTGAR